MAVFNTERGGQNFFYLVRGGTRIFFSFVRGDNFFLPWSEGGREKIGDSSSQMDAPLLIKNDTSLTFCEHCISYFFPQVGKGLVASADRSWASLGRYPDNCFPQPDTCDDGLTVSFWFRIDSTATIGAFPSVLSSRSNVIGGLAKGFSHFLYGGTFWYQVMLGTNR